MISAMASKMMRKSKVLQLYSLASNKHTEQVRHSFTVPTTGLQGDHTPCLRSCSCTTIKK
jgi:hypothetical protein